MKTKRTITSTRSMWATTLLAVAAAITLTLSAQAAGGGNGGNVGGNVSGWIFVNVVFDNDYLGVAANGPNGLLSDGLGAYVNGSQKVSTFVGRNFNILMDLNTQDNKPSQRKFKFQYLNNLNQLVAGFPPVKVCSAPDALCPPIPAPDSTTTFTCSASALRPTTGINGLVPNAELTIFGQDHDDTPVGCSRHVGARMYFTDSNGVKWWLYFGSRAAAGGNRYSPCGSCLTVTRLNNVDFANPGVSQWEFQTEVPHTVYLYRDNQPPNFPTEFYGTITLPLSGIMQSQTNELLPTGLCGSFSDSGDCP